MTRGTESGRCLPLVVPPPRDMHEICARLLALVRRWDERAARTAHAPSREVHQLFAFVLECIVEDAQMIGLDTAFVLEKSWRILHDLTSPVNVQVRERPEDLHPAYLVLRRELETELDAPQRRHR